MPVRVSKQAEHANAAKFGPLQRRALRSLRSVAEQFGELPESDTASSSGIELSVVVDADSGGSRSPLTLSYGKGDFIFSRVYDLKIVSRGRWQGAATPIRLRFERTGTRFEILPGLAADHVPLARRRVASLQKQLGNALRNVDLKSLEILAAGDGQYAISLVPIGGAYVWILVPPVSYTVRFPDGEPSRLLSLLRQITAVLEAS